MVYMFLAEGFEETEAIAAADVIVRGGTPVTLVSIMKDKMVTGSHGFKFQADMLFEEADFSDAQVLVLPGGMPGTKNLAAHAELVELLKKQNAAGKHIAAICAAPMVLGRNGLLQGRKAVCYPGFEEDLLGAEVLKVKAVTDGNVTTGRGAGAAVDFGLEIVKVLHGAEKAKNVAEDIIFI